MCKHIVASFFDFEFTKDVRSCLIGLYILLDLVFGVKRVGESERLSNFVYYSHGLLLLLLEIFKSGSVYILGADS